MHKIIIIVIFIRRFSTLCSQTDQNYTYYILLKKVIFKNDDALSLEV